MDSFPDKITFLLCYIIHILRTYHELWRETSQNPLSKDVLAEVFCNSGAVGEEQKC